MPEFTTRFTVHIQAASQAEADGIVKTMAADISEDAVVREVWAKRPELIKTPGRPSEDRELAEAWLVRWMKTKGKPVPSAKVFEAAEKQGISRRTLRRAADNLKIVRNPPRGGSHTTWSLPEEEATA